jgi:putative peptidoglycan lipid II flippase
VTVGVVAMSLNVVFSFLFSDLFERVGWMPHGGLALANSLATALEMAALLVLVRRRLGGIEGTRLLQGFGSAALGTVAMSLALWFWMSQMGEAAPWVVTAGGVTIGGVVYTVVIAALRVPEVSTLFRAVRSRLGYKS